MRNNRVLFSAIVGLVVGSIILLLCFLGSDEPKPKGSTYFEAGQRAGAIVWPIVGFLFFAGGFGYMILYLGSKPKKKKKKGSKAIKKAASKDELLTLTCSACHALFRTKSDNAGRKVKCPKCKASVVVPGDRDDETEADEFDGKIPLWMWISTGCFFTLFLICLVYWMIRQGPKQFEKMVLANNKTKQEQVYVVPKSPSKSGEAAPRKDPPKPAPKHRHQASPHLLSKERPFDIDPALKDKTGKVFLSNLSAFAYKPGPDGWTLGTHGALGDPQLEHDIHLDGPVNESIGMHPPDKDYTSASFVLGKSAILFTGAVGQYYPGRVSAGNYYFVILGDGKELWRSKTWSGDGKKEGFTIDVSSVDILELRAHCLHPVSQSMGTVWYNPELRLRAEAAAEDSANKPNNPPAENSSKGETANPPSTKYLNIKQKPFNVDPKLKGKTGSAYLCDLTPFALKIDFGWDLGTHNNTGYPGGTVKIIIDNKPLSHGIAMHPFMRDFSSVSYVLGKAGSKLSGDVGVSENHKDTPPADLVFVIRGDGKELWRSKALTGTGQRAPFDLDVSQVDVVELQIHCRGSHINLNPVWIDPLLKLKD